MRRREALRLGAAALGASVLGSGSSAAAGGQSYAPLGHLELPGAKELVLSADGSVGYVAVSDGYAILDLSDPADPSVLAERRGIDPDDVGTRTTPTGTDATGTGTGTATPTGSDSAEVMGMIFDVKVEGDTMVAVGPAHHNPRVAWGVLVVDVADPAAPRHVAFHGTGFPIHNCDLFDGDVYLTGNGETVHLAVMDVETGETVGTWALTEFAERWTDVHRRLRPLHDVTVRDGVAYLAHWDAGTWLLDVSDPSAPTVLGRVADHDAGGLAALTRDEAALESATPPGNSHTAAPNADGSLLAVGRESWAVRPDEDADLVGGPSGIDLYDVADPSAIRHLATIPPPTSPAPTIRGLWTTAHNFAFRGDILYTSWYHGGVKRFDVSDPAQPRELTWWRDATETRFWAARPTTQGFFVGSSMGTDAPAGMWTFPDGPGTGGLPLSAVTPTETGDGGDDGGHSHSDTPSPTPTRTASPPSRTTTTSPGLSVVAGVLGVGAAAAGVAWRARRPGSRVEDGEG